MHCMAKPNNQLVFLWKDDLLQSRLLLFSLFFLLSQLVAKLNVLVREMTHQQPEVLRGDRANFSFASLSIACVLVFTASNVACLWCWLGCHCPIIGSVFVMAKRQASQQCLVLALCHNLHCIHVRSCLCLLWVCLCPWVFCWLFRGIEP